MYHINNKTSFVECIKEVKLTSLISHEQVINDRLKLYIDYLKSLENNLLISSIIVCNKTNTIIDGHHRYHALIFLGYSYIPVTYINYDSVNIKAHINDSISKNEILTASQSGKLLPPKSSKHVFYDKKTKLWLPIILISTLCLLIK
jgi:hypothetical protein